MIVLLVSLVFSILGNITGDMEDYYDVEVNHTLGEDYDYAGRINKSVYGIKNNFDTISDEDAGWFSKIGAGITAIPEAVITVVSVLFTSMGYGIQILTGIGSELAVPAAVVSTAIVGLIVIVVFSIVSYWRRYKA